MSTRKKLVVLGTGWASYSFLRNINPDLYKVIVISPRNHFLFTPLLASTTVGTLEFRSIIQPIRDRQFENKIDFRLGAKCLSWDMENKRIKCVSVLEKRHVDEDPEFYVDYDKLVIGVGALPHTFGVKGVKEHALFLKEVSDARMIRNRLLANFDRVSLPNANQTDVDKILHVVIVGGGPTGVEFGAELYDFINQDVARLYKIDGRFEVSVTLIEASQILSSFDKRLQAYAEKKIRARKNFKLMKSLVIEVRSDSVVLQDGTVVPCGLTVWSTGLAPQPFTKELKVEKNKQGQIVVDDYLQVVSDQSKCSFAIGDCSHALTQSIPCTAQAAEREGRYLAKLFNFQAKYPGRHMRPFKFINKGMLAYIGGYEGVADLHAPDWKLKGISSWFLWRSAYFTRLGSWRLRLQVPLDWLKTFIFGRDTSRFE